MATDARQKRPAEVQQIGVDFGSKLVSGDALVTANTGITVRNVLTDVDVTSTILVSGSKAVSGDVLSGRFQAGSNGDTHEIVFSTGQTDYLHTHEKTANLEVTNTPDTDNLLASRDEVKRKLNITDTSDDQLLDDFLLMASKYIRSRCARNFHLETYTDRIYIRPPFVRLELVTVEEFPLIQVDQIVLSSYDDLLQYTITDQSTYKWDFNREGQIFFKDGTLFYKFPAYNEITYRAGHAKIPDDLREACKELVAWMYQSGENQGLQSERIGDYMYTKRSLDQVPFGMRMELPIEFIEGVIQRYRRYDFLNMP
jgi:hypothetical protein